MRSKSTSRSFRERSSRPMTFHLCRNSNSACLPFSPITSARHRPSTGPSPATTSMLFWSRSAPNGWLLRPDEYVTVIQNVSTQEPQRCLFQKDFVYPVLCASSRADVHDVPGGTLPLLIHSQKRSEGLDYDKRGDHVELPCGVSRDSESAHRLKLECHGDAWAPLAVFRAV
jgi:hypothetical protein